MTQVCPIVIETSVGVFDAYAIKEGQDVKFVGHDMTPVEDQFSIKGFRSETIKQMWLQEILPAITMGGFDPCI